MSTSHEKDEQVTPINDEQAMSTTENAGNHQATPTDNEGAAQATHTDNDGVAQVTPTECEDDKEATSGRSDNVSATETDTSAIDLSSIHSFCSAKLLSLLIDVVTAKLSVKNIVKVLRAPGLDVNGSLSRGLRPLHYAAYVDNHDAIQLLIYHEADPNLPDESGYTPLHLAAKHGHLKSLQALLSNRAIVNFSETSTRRSAKTSRALDALTINPLNLALQGNHVDCVEALLVRGAEANRAYFLGSELTLVPLENVECLALLLKFGADPDAYSRGGTTTLMNACRYGNDEAARILVDNGADVNRLTHEKLEQRYALHYSALKGNLEISTLLLDHGAVTKMPAGGRYSPLEFAITQDHVDVVGLLLARGADVNEENVDDCTPLQIACSTAGLYHGLKIIKILLEHGALPNFSRPKAIFNASSPSLTPLVEYFTYHDYFEIDIVRMLILFGAEVNLCLPTRLFRITDGCGLLSKFYKLQTRPILMRLLLEAAGNYDCNAIRMGDNLLSDEQKETLMLEAMHPRSLLHQSRLNIRRFLPAPIPNKIPALPLPEFLQNYLLFKV